MDFQQQKCTLELMKEAIRQALELAAENAEIKINIAIFMEGYYNENIIIKESITNTINQII